jgi:hypothetical protein
MERDASETSDIYLEVDELLASPLSYPGIPWKRDTPAKAAVGVDEGPGGPGVRWDAAGIVANGGAQGGARRRHSSLAGLLLPECHSDQPPYRLRLRGLRVRLGRDPGIQLGIHLRIEADADDRADAGFRASAASFLINRYCAAPEYTLTSILAGAGLAPAFTTATPCEGGEGWLLGSLIEARGKG